MLNKIMISNMNSIGDCTIDFKKKSYKFLNENVLGNNLNPIAIYGHNGSGKSSFFKSIQQMLCLMIFPIEKLNSFVPNYFLFDECNKKNNFNSLISSISLFFDIDEHQYEYSISTTMYRRIEKEYLKMDKMIIFKRDVNTETYQNQTNNISNNRSLLIPTLRYLAALNINDLIIQNVYSYISNFVFVNLPMQEVGGFVTSRIFSNTNIYDLLISKSEEVKELLKTYEDFPIYSILKINNPINLPNSDKYFIQYEGLEDYKLPFGLISNGMKNQSILLSILVSLPQNSVLFIDELELALHPSTIVSFLEIVKKKKIQLVFSSHNTHILQHLRPDQIYFANWKNGFSNFDRLSTIYPNIREVNNLEKMYLSNLFDIED